MGQVTEEVSLPGPRAPGQLLRAALAWRKRAVPSQDCDSLSRTPATLWNDHSRRQNTLPTLESQKSPWQLMELSQPTSWSRHCSPPDTLQAAKAPEAVMGRAQVWVSSGLVPCPLPIPGQPPTSRSGHSYSLIPCCHPRTWNPHPTPAHTTLPLVPALTRDYELLKGFLGS